MAITRHFGDGVSTHFSTQYTPSKDFTATVGGEATAVAASTPTGVFFAAAPAAGAEILITHTAGSYPVGVEWLTDENGNPIGQRGPRGETLGGAVDVRAFGAVGDGVADDTAAIQAAVNALVSRPNGYFGESTGLILYIPWGTFRITSPIVIPNNAGISFVGEGGTKSKIWQATNGQHAFTLSGNNYRGRFKGLHITGSQGQVGGDARGLSITGSGNQIYVEDCWLTLFGYCIYGAPTSDSNFTNNVFEFSQTPIYLAEAGNGFFHITGNQFYNCGPVSLGASESRASFEFDGTSNVLFSDNRIVVDLPMSPQTTNGVFKLTGVNDFVFSDNIFTNTNYDGRTIVGDSCNRLKISGNVFKSNRGSTIRLTSCNDVVIAENTIPAMKNLGAVADNCATLISCSGVRFSLNRVGGATLYQVHVTGAGSEDIHVTNNLFSGGSNIAGYFPLLVDNCNGAVVTGNVFKAPSGNTADFASNLTSNLVFENNCLAVGYAIDVTARPARVDGNIGPGSRTYLSAAPVAGSWVAGDKVYFEAPTAGGFVGAVCVTSGSPGTWKTFGAVSA
jgi:hypothetical protein